MGTYTILYSAVVSGTASTGSPGDVLIPDATSGLYVRATTANRGSRRATGIALTSYVAGGTVDIIQYGEVPTTLTGFSAAAASWVRCSAAGSLEKVTPGVGDDIMGKVDSDGRLFLDPGKWDSTNYTSSSSGGFTPPTGTGLMKVTTGAMDVASSLLVNADVSASAAIAASKVVQATGTGIPHVIAGVLSAASSLIVDADVTSVAIGKITGLAANVAAWLATSSGANLAAALTSALPVSKGGTNRTALGSSLQVLRTNVGATDTEWATISGGGAPAGSSGEVQYNNAGSFGGATNVVTGSGFISIGVTPAAVGALRLPNASASLLTVRNSLNTNDLNIASTDGSDNLNIGMDVAYTAAKQFTGVNVYGLSTVAVGIGSSTKLYITSSANENWQPIIGSNGGASPYGVHGESAYDMNNANQTLPAANYAYNVIKVTSTTNFTANRQLTFPTPASDAVAYQKLVRNTQGGAFSVNVTCSAGTSVSIAQGKAAWILFDTTGAVRMSADV